jgi:hypothetical protein
VQQVSLDVDLARATRVLVLTDRLWKVVAEDEPGGC